MNKSEFLKKAIVKELGPSDMLEFIIDDAIDRGDDYNGLEADATTMAGIIRGVYRYLDDVINHGCGSGVVYSLIEYSETTKFFNDFRDEIIEELDNIDYFETCQDTLRDYFENPEEVKNNMAWAAYESIAFNIHEFIDERLYKAL